MTLDMILRVFCIIVGVSIFVLVVVGGVGLFAGLPRWTAVVYIAGNIIGCYVAMFGIRELLSGGRLGVTTVFWILIGIGINYIVARETWPAMTKVMAKKGLVPLVRTRMSLRMELLGLVLLALLLVIILVLSGRSDFPPFGFPW